MSNSHNIRSCEVCDSTDLIPVLDLGDQPMCDDLVPIGSNAVPRAYPLRLLGCNRCITVHQAVQVEKHLLFPQTYHYRAALTQDVLDGMRELVTDVAGLVGGLSGRTVLDIGCNDGSLLSRFREQGARTAGIEPTGASEDARPKVDWLHHGFFDSKAVDAYLELHPQPDIVTFTNVFAHIEDLNGLLANLKRLIGPNTKVVIENHYLGAVVDRAQFDTFYHEHPRTYSFRSFQHIAAKLGRTIEHIGFPKRYNGNIRVVIGAGAETTATAPDENGFIKGVQQMQAVIAQARERILHRLQPLAKRYGPLPAKAFPGRAAILIHCFGIDEKLIDATYERSSSPKIGNYIPGTRIEIRDEEELFRERLDSPVMVNFAWHIRDEIERYVRAKGFRGELISIFE
jgi:SAM-dependent methyltransferase